MKFLHKRFQALIIAGSAVAFVMAVPALAHAQRRGPVRGPAVRSVIYVGPYAYPRFYYDPWYQFGYPYPYPPFGYPYAGGYDYSASLRIQVKPNNAEVFVDGYHAGVVDDFDGAFQRLHVRPGGHEITIFLEGYQTVRESIYLQAGASRKLQFDLNKLGPGERSEPPAAPAAAEVQDQASQPAPAPPLRRMPPPDRENPGERVAPAPARFGTLSLRIQPSDAEILVDGEHWAAPAGQDRVSIQLAEGRHRVEVRREGMATYAEDVLIRRNATLTLNVSLK